MGVFPNIGDTRLEPLGSSTGKKYNDSLYLESIESRTGGLVMNDDVVHCWVKAFIL